MVVVQRNPKVGAHAAELFGGKRQTAAGAFKGAQKRRTGFLRSHGVAACGKHTPVKGGIVRKQAAAPSRKASICGHSSAKVGASFSMGQVKPWISVNITREDGGLMRL